MSLSDIVNRIRADFGSAKDVPGFDPQNGNESAKYLLLLEAPGPQAVQSGMISQNNPDPSARALKQQLAEAQITPNEIAIWNVVPWYIGNENRSRIRSARSSDIQQGIAYLREIVSAMPNLKAIVLVGTAARKSHVSLSQFSTARIVACHHTSQQAMNGNPEAEAENIKVFRFLKSTT